MAIWGRLPIFLPVFARFVETAQKSNLTFVKIYRLQYWYPSAKIRTRRSTKQQERKGFHGVQFPGLLSLIKRTIKMEGGFYGRIKTESDRKIRR